MPEPAAVTTFAAVRGHERPCRILRTAVANDRLAHALLFAGPDGIGKRLVALALTAWLQCEARNDDACGVCSACRQVAAGSHPDVQIVSLPAGKKEIGIDRVRELKRFMQLRPVGDKAKVGIVDQAQLLTIAAQNALLKTLEEPPPRSLLIMVASTPDALLPTVRSRCQRLQFAPLSTDVVAAILQREQPIDAATAHAFASVAEGSPGRALTLSKSLDAQERERLLQQLAGLGGAGYVRLSQLAQDLGQPEAQTAMKLELLLSAYRDAALHAVGAGHLMSAEGSAAGSSQSDLRTLLGGAAVINDAWNALRRGNPNRTLLLEAVLLRLARV